jgi:hypothetical protein
MTSISATSNGSYPSPLQKLQDQLQAEVNSGAISASDQNALSSALTDISSSLQNDSAGSSASGTNASPGDLQSKIDGLIANEVSSGKLTSDQATELQGVFKATFANAAGEPSQAGGAHHGHHGGHGSPPPGDSSSASGGTSSANSTSDILQQFLQSLQGSLSASASTPYGATGISDPASNSGASSSSLLINYQA